MSGWDDWIDAKADDAREKAPARAMAVKIRIGTWATREFAATIVAGINDRLGEHGSAQIVSTRADRMNEVVHDPDLGPSEKGDAHLYVEVLISTTLSPEELARLLNEEAESSPFRFTWEEVEEEPKHPPHTTFHPWEAPPESEWPSVPENVRMNSKAADDQYWLDKAASSLDEPVTLHLEYKAGDRVVTHPLFPANNIYGGEVGTVLDVRRNEEGSTMVTVRFPSNGPGQEHEGWRNAFQPVELLPADNEDMRPQVERSPDQYFWPDKPSDEQVRMNSKAAGPSQPAPAPEPKVVPREDEEHIGMGDEVQLDPSQFAAGQTGRVVGLDPERPEKAVVRFYNGHEQEVFKRDLLLIEPNPNPHGLRYEEPSQEKLDALRQKIQDAVDAGDMDRARQLYQQYESVTASLAGAMCRTAKAIGTDDLARFVPGDLLAMVTGYLEAALWSSTDNTADSGGQPLDKHYGLRHLDEASVKAAVEDCKAFRDKAGELLDGQDESRAGHDFWLTRNGHGAGFWDRPEIYGEDEAKKLTELAKSFGTSDALLTWGPEDAVIHLSEIFRG